jgi:hypothetical protein
MAITRGDKVKEFSAYQYKEVNNDALIRLLEKVDAREYISLLIRMIKKEGLTNFERNLLEKVNEKYATAIVKGDII